MAATDKRDGRLRIAVLVADYIPCLASTSLDALLPVLPSWPFVPFVPFVENRNPWLRHSKISRP
jgi:hypothetical protein